MSLPLPPEDRASRRVGTTLGGKYVIERVLGVGGMATVYMGVHRNGRRVAIKVLHEELGIHRDVRARFVREGYVANAVGHDGAVRVFDDDCDADGVAFLVMELLLGETLSDRCRRRGDTLPCREVLALAHQLLDVLAAAHAHGVIHRDIKPENLFLTTEGTLKVLDFGIARMKDDAGSHATMTGARIGTPAFMPPEQALGRTAEIDARTDLWAVGATAFALLAGRSVHVAESAAELVVITATTPPRSLAEFAPDLPAAVIAVVDRALQFRRDERWPDARAMQQALDAAHIEAFGEPLAANEVGPLPASLISFSRREDERETQALQAARAETAVTPQPPSQKRPSEDIASAPTRPSDRDWPASSAPRVDPTLAPATLRPRVSSPPPEGASTPPPAPTGATQAAPRGRWQRTAALLVAAVVASFGLATWLARPPAPGGPATTTSRSGSGSAPTPSTAPGCTGNRECVAANGGAASICRKDDGVCVTLATDQCKVLASPGDVENDATVWIGAMFPSNLPDLTHWGPQSANAIELARRDFAETSGGLLPVRAGGPKRPIGVVLCDDFTAPGRVAEHLVRDVRVPVVIGFGRSRDVLDLAAPLFVPNQVLMLAANTASALRDLPRAPGGQRLVWRITTSSEAFIAGQVALVSDFIEPDLRAQPGVLAPGQPIRVAMLRGAGPIGQGFADGLLSTLRFNGKSVAENGPQFRQIVTTDTSDDIDQAEVSRLAAEICAFSPHVFVDGGSNVELAAEVERLWPASAPFRPRYVGINADIGPDMALAMRKWPDLGRRAFRTDMLPNEAVAKFVLRYNEIFTPRVTTATAVSAPYDAFYLFAYAAAALGDKPITGAALAAAIARVQPPGEPIDVGGGGIYKAFYALAAGKNVDLQGGQTTLDFDPVTGDPALDMAVFCASPGNAGEPPHVLESGLFFRARSKKLEGTFRCH